MDDNCLSRSRICLLAKLSGVENRVGLRSAWIKLCTGRDDVVAGENSQRNAC